MIATLAQFAQHLFEALLSWLITFWGWWKSGGAGATNGSAIQQIVTSVGTIVTVRIASKGFTVWREQKRAETEFKRASEVAQGADALFSKMSIERIHRYPIFAFSDIDTGQHCDKKSQWKVAAQKIEEETNYWQKFQADLNNMETELLKEKSSSHWPSLSEKNRTKLNAYLQVALGLKSEFIAAIESRLELTDLCCRELDAEPIANEGLIKERHPILFKSSNDASRDFESRCKRAQADLHDFLRDFNP